MNKDQKDISLDLAALIFGQAQDFNTIFLAALEQDKRKERKQEPEKEEAA